MNSSSERDVLELGGGAARWRFERFEDAAVH